MKINQVLVVYKQVSTTHYGKKGTWEKRIREGNQLHLETLNELYEILKEFGISFITQSIRQLKNVSMCDLVITVGGDGTVLAASHFVNNEPVLWIKSFGRQSVGYFCAATRKTMKKYLKELIIGKRKPIKLHRLQVSINGKVLDELPLNDVLFSRFDPAGTSKYKLVVGNRAEEQKSSGVWISTAAGSTAAIKAAGGKILPLTSNKVEYLVREPYVYSKRYKMIKGIVSPKTPIKIISMLANGTIFIDGDASQYPVPTGSVVSIKGANKPLFVYWR